MVIKEGAFRRGVAGGWLNLGCSVSLTDVSPDSSYVNGFSTDVALFDTLEIQYIIHWSIDKKLLRSEM